MTGDIRALTYTQIDRFKDAPLNLVYVADLEKTGGGEEASMMVTVAMDAAFIAENVYLYCASEELPTAFRLSIDKDKLSQAMKLRPTQRIMGAQSVGLPKGRLGQQRINYAGNWLMNQMVGSGSALFWCCPGLLVFGFVEINEERRSGVGEGVKLRCQYEGRKSPLIGSWLPQHPRAGCKTDKLMSLA